MSNVHTIPGFMLKGRPDVCTMYILYLVLCLKVGLMYVQCTYEVPSIKNANLSIKYE